MRLPHRRRKTIVVVPPGCLAFNFWLCERTRMLRVRSAHSVRQLNRNQPGHPSETGSKRAIALAAREQDPPWLAALVRGISHVLDTPLLAMPRHARVDPSIIPESPAFREMRLALVPRGEPRGTAIGETRAAPGTESSRIRRRGPGARSMDRSGGRCDGSR